MRRVLLICLTLVLALVSWSTVCAEDGFYVIQVIKKSPPVVVIVNAGVPKTGQTATYGTNDDGALKKGVASPTPRFTDNNNGTVTDNLTKLIWMKNASIFTGPRTWADAMSTAEALKHDTFGLTDGSQPGDWRLPNVRELLSLVNYGWSGPALPNTLGTGRWAEGNPFQGVYGSLYWSSTTWCPPDTPNYAWYVNLFDGRADSWLKSNYCYVWCVRGGP